MNEVYKQEIRGYLVFDRDGKIAKFLNNMIVAREYVEEIKSSISDDLFIYDFTTGRIVAKYDYESKSIKDLNTSRKATIDVLSYALYEHYERNRNQKFFQGE
ncbi:hypothetical protein IJ380_04010 [Candidatus Saccharibacteria bacterium]|nr:hypothetical protein [Candidatus Saccharibacteria bacterium]